MFSVKLYANRSPSNKVDKNISYIGEGQCVLKEKTDILEPLFLIESPASSALLKSTNYAYVEEFGRYYYITDVTSISSNIWALSMKVDVLMSYKSEIKRQFAIVSRQEKVYNMMLDDGWFAALQNPIIQTKYLSVTAPFSSNEYILTIAGS